ncbi:MAG: AtpZ/AtpI family protein [Anaerolineae bacterium]|nr:AtpZ/AtpI family protein [Anaerolineae bacterium]
MSDELPHRELTGSRPRNLTYAAIAGQAGLVTILVVFIALFAGLWLDAQFGLRGPFTIGLLALSVPVSLFLMVRLALSATGAIRPARPEEPATIAKED